MFLSWNPSSPYLASRSVTCLLVNPLFFVYALFPLVFFMISYFYDKGRPSFGQTKFLLHFFTISCKLLQSCVFFHILIPFASSCKKEDIAYIHTQHPLILYFSIPPILFTGSLRQRHPQRSLRPAVHYPRYGLPTDPRNP